MINQNNPSGGGFDYSISENIFINSENKALQRRVDQYGVAQAFTVGKNPSFMQDFSRDGFVLPEAICYASLVRNFCFENNIDESHFYNNSALFFDYVKTNFIEYYNEVSENKGEEIAHALFYYYDQKVGYFGNHIIQKFFTQLIDETFSCKDYNCSITPLLDKDGNFYLSVLYQINNFFSPKTLEYADFSGSYTYNIYPDYNEEAFKLDLSSLKASNKAFELMAKGDFSKSFDEIVEFANAQEKFNSTYVHQNISMLIIPDECEALRMDDSFEENILQPKIITEGLHNHAKELFYESGHLFEQKLLPTRKLSQILNEASDTLKNPSSQNARKLLKTGSELKNTFTGRKIGGILLLLGGTLLALSSGIAVLFTGGATIAGCVAGAAIATAGVTMLGLGTKNRAQFFGETAQFFKQSVDINEDYNQNPKKYEGIKNR